MNNERIIHYTNALNSNANGPTDDDHADYAMRSRSEDETLQDQLLYDGRPEDQLSSDDTPSDQSPQQFSNTGGETMEQRQALMHGKLMRSQS